MVVAALLSGGHRDATVSERKPEFLPLRSTVSGLVGIEHQLLAAEKAGDPLVSLGNHLSAARSAERRLQHNPWDVEARESYNFAVARLFSGFNRAQGSRWQGPLRLSSADGESMVDHRHDKAPERQPGLYDFTPVDELDAKGLYVPRHMRSDGLGAPLVVVGKADNQDAREAFHNSRTCYGITALANFQGNRCTLSFEDPLAESELVVPSPHSARQHKQAIQEVGRILKRQATRC